MGQDFLLPCAAVHVGVDLGGRYVLMSEHFLYNPQIGSMLDQVGGERMSEGVRRNVLEDARCKGVFLYDLEQGDSADGLSESVEEYKVVRLCVRNGPVFHVCIQRFNCHVADRNQSFLIALSYDAEESLLKEKRRNLQS